MHGLSNGENIFDLWWPLKVNGQGQTAKKLRNTFMLLYNRYTHSKPSQKQWMVPCWLQWLLQCALCCVWKHGCPELNSSWLNLPPNVFKNRQIDSAFTWYLNMNLNYFEVVDVSRYYMGSRIAREPKSSIRVITDYQRLYVRWGLRLTRHPVTVLYL